MLNLFKKEEFCVSCPISGTLINLEDVPDEVFSKKMMGDGFAIIPQANDSDIVAPLSGKITMVSETLHAVGIKTFNGLEILIHIGIDTVKLGGQGFKSYVTNNQKVKRRQKLISFDPDYMKKNNINMTTMVIFVNGYDEDLKLLKEYNSLVNSEDILLR